MTKRSFLAVIPVAAALFASGCVSTAGGNNKVEASESQCKSSVSEIAAGTHRFQVTNNGQKVTEVEFLTPDGRAVGEIENVGPSTTRDLTVDLEPGSYEIACRPEMKGFGVRTPLKVTGTNTTEPLDPALASAVASYRGYVDEQADLALTRTKDFAAAVKSRDVEKAKALYPSSREPWERIEPIAESFGDLDPRVDAREGDLEEGVRWTGWHRLEKDLWVSGLQGDSGEIADTLLADLGELKTKVTEVDLKPAQISEGARALLDEIATGKVTGEEERYSHTDLVDLNANLEGSKRAIESLRPYLESKDKALLESIDERMQSAFNEVALYKSGDSFINYEQVNETQRKALATKIEALSEPISKVTGVVTNK